VRHGLIWVGLDSNQTELDVASFLGTVDDDLMALDLQSHRFYQQHARIRKTNWKLVMEAFQEVYHIKRLHARTISPFFVNGKSAGEPVGPHLRILVPRDKFLEAADVPPEDWSP
jgi:glycine betaine catabolism A